MVGAWVNTSASVYSWAHTAGRPPDSRRVACGPTINDKSTGIIKPLLEIVHRMPIYLIVDLTTRSAGSCEPNHHLARSSPQPAITASA
jgi:hypothetical protein